MTADDAGGRTGYVGQNRVERTAVPPVLYIAAIGGLDLGAQSEALQVLLDAPRAAGVDGPPSSLDTMLGVLVEWGCGSWPTATAD